MSASKIFHCIVDDTALITNISEIETWVLRGSITLVIPLHTLERLHLLKKDTSQIGQNARKAVKFLDQATSNQDLTDPVAIQGPDEQYSTWAEVEAHYNENHSEIVDTDSVDLTKAPADEDDHREPSKDKHSPNEFSHTLLNKLSLEKEFNIASPLSTPPLSPSSSAPQSTKTSPEVKSATMITNDVSPVPPTLKGLINPVVWYTYEKKAAMPSKNIVFLTNSSDTGYLARDFGVSFKNIHQLRNAIGVEQKEVKNHGKYSKKHNQSSAVKVEAEPQTLFRYDEESEEEEVVFKPRNRGTPRTKGNTNTRGNGNGSGSVKSRGGPGHSPAASISIPAQAPQATPVKPQIPTEEIDPDSFDRGSFARGSTPLVSVGSHTPQQPTNSSRGNGQRGNSSTGGPSRGGHYRGGRGLDRGGARGRGRLFVP